MVSSGGDEDWVVAGFRLSAVLAAAERHGSIGVLVVDQASVVRARVVPGAPSPPGPGGDDVILERHAAQFEAVVRGSFDAQSAHIEASVGLIVPVLDRRGRVVGATHLWTTAITPELTDDVDADLRAIVRELTRHMEPADEAASRGDAVLAAIERRVNALTLLITLVTLVIGVLFWRATRPQIGAETGHRAPIGALRLPASVAPGPNALTGVDDAGPADPAAPTPLFTGSADRHGCSTECSYELGYVDGGDASASHIELYVAEAFPIGESGPASMVAAAMNDDGHGSVVVTVPFVEGWICYRILATVGARRATAAVASHGPWSSAKCFYLDGDGYVTRRADRK